MRVFCAFLLCADEERKKRKTVLPIPRNFPPFVCFEVAGCTAGSLEMCAHDQVGIIIHASRSLTLLPESFFPGCGKAKAATTCATCIPVVQHGSFSPVPVWRAHPKRKSTKSPRSQYLDSRLHYRKYSVIVRHCHSSREPRGMEVN